jgi:hypothetical protein
VGQRVEGEETVKMKVIMKEKMKGNEGKNIMFTHTHTTVSTNVPYMYTSNADTNVRV